MTAELVLAVGKSFLFVFAAILPILNPAATAPIFLGLSELLRELLVPGVTLPLESALFSRTCRDGGWTL